MSVRFLRKEIIEKNASFLLKQFIQEKGRFRGAVPIEEVVMFLGLSLDYDDLSQRFGVDSEILGFINVESKEIFIEEKLLPEENPYAQEGRYRFTVGHEIGHWILHKDQAHLPHPASVFESKASSTKPWMEWQADYFATCLLMPRRWILKAVEVKGWKSLPPEKIIYRISQWLGVSKQAARIRLEELGVIEPSVQEA